MHERVDVPHPLATPQPLIADLLTRYAPLTPCPQTGETLTCLQRILGAVPLPAPTPTLLRQWRERLRQDLAPEAVDQCMAVLTTVFTNALRAGAWAPGLEGALWRRRWGQGEGHGGNLETSLTTKTVEVLETVEVPENNHVRSTPTRRTRTEVHVSSNLTNGTDGQNTERDVVHGEAHWSSDGTSSTDTPMEKAKAKGSPGNQYTGELDRSPAVTSPTLADLGMTNARSPYRERPYALTPVIVPSRAEVPLDPAPQAPFRPVAPMGQPPTMADLLTRYEAEHYTYTSSFVGEIACNQTAQALMPAVQNLIGRLVHHPAFLTLVR